MEIAQRTPDCLDEATIAAVVEGRVFDGRQKALAHVSECAYCRYRVAAVARVAQDPAVKKEIDTLEPERHSTMSPRLGWKFFATAGLAAAAAAVVLIEPTGTLRGRFTSRGDEVHREAAITTTESPRIISPSGTSTVSTLRWTGVPEADMYRVRIWNQNGDVVWSGETRDTVIAIPSAVERGVSYLWEVNARTGWDRWTSSEFVEFTIGSSPSR
jgi:hypothetical protein